MVSRHIDIRLPRFLGFKIHRHIAIDDERVTGQITDITPGNRVDIADHVRRLMQTVTLGLVIWQ